MHEKMDDAKRNKKLIRTLERNTETSKVTFTNCHQNMPRQQKKKKK